MGGKNPAVVLGYQDVTKVAAQIASAAFACSGQRCTAISRVIVLNSLHDDLTEALVQAIKKIKVGPAWDPERSEEHTSELQSLMRISYAVFCLNKKKQRK